MSGRASLGPNGALGRGVRRQSAPCRGALSSASVFEPGAQEGFKPCLFFLAGLLFANSFNLGFNDWRRTEDSHKIQESSVHQYLCSSFVPKCPLLYPCCCLAATRDDAGLGGLAGGGGGGIDTSLIPPYAPFCSLYCCLDNGVSSAVSSAYCHNP